jgi:hypothetical protein
MDWRSIARGKSCLSPGHISRRRHTPTRHAKLAMHIIDLAKTGERDVNRLRDHAVAFVFEALQRKQA